MEDRTNPLGLAITTQQNVHPKFTRLQTLLQSYNLDMAEFIEKRRQKVNNPLPNLDVGDTIQIDVLIQEIVKSDTSSLGRSGQKSAKKIVKERIQSYSGVVIAIKNKGINKTITVRRIFQGVGIERVFNLFSPSIDKIQILKRASVRRAKLYYLRNKFGKSAKLKQKCNPQSETEK